GIASSRCGGRGKGQFRPIGQDGAAAGAYGTPARGPAVRRGEGRCAGSGQRPLPRGAGSRGKEGPTAARNRPPLSAVPQAGAERAAAQSPTGPAWPPDGT